MALALPLPPRPVPRVVGVDDFALRKRRYATVIVNAETSERVDVLSDRQSETLESWLREHPGVEDVCRDGSAAYAETSAAGCLVRYSSPTDGTPTNPAEAVFEEVAAHSSCWGKTGPPPRAGKQARTTRERWQRSTTCWTRESGCSRSPAGCIWR